MKKYMVSVYDFGAIGDGVTCDFTAIKNAIDYVTNQYCGGTVYFPPGVYNLERKKEK